MCDQACAFAKRWNALKESSPDWAKHLFEIDDMSTKRWRDALKATPATGDDPRLEDLWWLVGILLNASLGHRITSDTLMRQILEQELNYGKRETITG